MPGAVVRGIPEAAANPRRERTAGRIGHTPPEPLPYVLADSLPYRHRHTTPDAAVDAGMGVLAADGRHTCAHTRLGLKLQPAEAIVDAGSHVVGGAVAHER